MQSLGPSKNLYGITHDAAGNPRIIEPKTVKVGIGLAKGKAIHVYIDRDQKWVVMCGYGSQVSRERFDSKNKAQMRYRELKQNAPARKYPERLPYFTFSHVAGNGDFEPEWDVIESHGPIPIEIDVIFIHDDPFTASYQLWGATEKKCDGDGKVALRVLSMAATPEEKALAAEAEKRGEKYFPVNQCWLMQCPYSRPTSDRPAQCRPMGRLLFQLLNSPRLGGTAVFNTSGYRSISQIFSSLEIFKRATGAGDPARGFVAGIPLKMVLRPYRVTHEGKPVTQYAVSLEFRAESALALKRAIVEHSVQFRMAGSEPLKQLEGISVPEIPATPEPEENPAAILAEFESTPGPEDRPSSPDPEEYDSADLGPAGELEHAWEEPEQDSQAQPQPPPPPEQDSNPATDIRGGDFTNRPAGENARASQKQYTEFYQLCRQQGMTDTIILDHLGSAGFEKPDEITVKALPELIAWAKQYKPAAQGTFL